MAPKEEPRSLPFKGDPPSLFQSIPPLSGALSGHGRDGALRRPRALQARNRLKASSEFGPPPPAERGRGHRSAMTLPFRNSHSYLGWDAVLVGEEEVAAVFVLEIGTLTDQPLLGAWLPRPP